jgi:hypothetical protein
LNRFRIIFTGTLYASSFITSSRNSAVGVVDGLQIGRLRNRGSVHGRAREFSRASRLALGPTQPPAHSVGTGVLSPGVMRPLREADTSPHLLLRLRMSGAIPPLPPYAFMACIGAALPVTCLLYFPSFVLVPVFCFLLFSRRQRRQQQQQQQL